MNRDLFAPNGIYRGLVNGLIICGLELIGHWFQRKPRPAEDTTKNDPLPHEDDPLPHEVQDAPKMLDIIFFPKSPYVLIMQFMSACLANHECMLLIYRSMKTSNYGEFVAAYPIETVEVRAKFLIAAVDSWATSQLSRLNCG